MESKMSAVFPYLILVIIWHFPGLTKATENNNGCVKVFEAMNRTDTFHGTCVTLNFPCNSTLGHLPVPGNCAQYFVCARTILYKCSCAAGTAYNNKINACGDDFNQNCTCPGGFSTTTTTKTTTMATTPEVMTTEAAPKAGGLSAGVVAAIVVVVVVVIIIIVIIVVCIRRKQAQKFQRSGFSNKTYNNDNDDTIKSTTSSDKYAAIGEVTKVPPLPKGRDTLPGLSSWSEDPVYDNRGVSTHPSTARSHHSQTP